MGVYLNPGNSGFQEIRNGMFVDKSGLIELVNEKIDTPDKLICISRPRRFGKSFAAQMLCAYYDKSCDSSSLFDNLEIAGASTFRKYLNQFDVIYLDMTNILGNTTPKDFLDFIRRNLIEELLQAYPEVKAGNTLDQTLINAVNYTGNKFVMIIDEWDAPIREAAEIETEYIRFLRMLFKSSGTTSKIFSAVYMTGILPIKKDGSQSAVSNFKEYTMLRPGRFGRYTGFTEEEVRGLCDKYHADVAKMKEWYDGYSFPGIASVYNPNSVISAIENEEFDSYWSETSSAKELMDLISLDYKGMAKRVAELIGGIDVQVDPMGFANDMTNFHGRDDVLTLLIHLGYLAYDSESKSVRIPNEEIRREFSRAIRKADHTETLRRVRESDQLILDTIHKNEAAVAAQIEKVHTEETSPLFYNNEQALRSTIKLAYYTYREHYLQFEELPSGEGYADIVYLPKRDTEFPALLIELKWNKGADSAIEQIHRKKYPKALEGFGGKLLLVGVSYDKDAPAGSRKHSCLIEEW